MNKIIILIMMTILTSCEKKSENKTIWVNSYKTDCVGVGPMKCMLVKTDKDAKWTNFYQKIEGFDYQPGYKYELEVKIDSLDISKLPADMSSLRYTLINEISKESDRSLRVNDIWVLEKLGAIELDDKKPQMEISVVRNKVMGKGFCNRLIGGIKKLTDTDLEFSEFMSTKMACPSMEKENEYTNALNNTRHYIIKNNKLMLFDSNNSELLVYRKID
jgi:heat shock protein HslJ